MQNGGWGVVIVIIVLAIVTGFMVNAYIEGLQHAAISQATQRNLGEMLNNAHGTATASASDMQKLQDNLATATAFSGICQDEKSRIGTDLKDAQAGIDQAEATIAYQKATIAAMGQSRPPVGEASQHRTIVSSVRATPIPLTGKILQREAKFSLSWLPALALGFFVIVVAAAYRMLKIEDQQQSQAR